MSKIIAGFVLFTIFTTFQAAAGWLMPPLPRRSSHHWSPIYKLYICTYKLGVLGTTSCAETRFSFSDRASCEAEADHFSNFFLPFNNATPRTGDISVMFDCEEQKP